MTPSNSSSAQASSQAADSPHALASANSDELAIVAPSVAGSITRFFAYHLPLYMVVGALVLIAIPRPVVDRFFAPQVQQSIGKVAAAPAAVASTTSVVANAPVATAADKGTIEIARMTLDDARTQSGSMKENYDRLFSLIAAMAALLAFLGFRGLDTYITTKQTAENLVKRAAKAQADAAKVDTFIKEKYVEDNRAEINVTMGIVLRHVADSYEAILGQVSPGTPPLKDHKYRDDLTNALYYLKKAIASPSVDAVVAERAMSTMGNVYRRLGRYQEAIDVLEDVIRKYPDSKDDENVHFNLACYYCQLAKQSAAGQNVRDSDRAIQKSLTYLRRAIEIAPDYADDAKTDPDFEWFVTTGNQAFKALTERQPVVPPNAGSRAP